MKLRKIFSVILSLCMLVGVCVLPRPAAAADNPSYLVRGEVSGGKLVLHVYLRGALGYSGRLALSYDSDALELADSSSFTKAVKSTSVASVTAEGHDDSVLLGDGYVMFAWHTSATTGVNARSADKEVAAITFNMLGSEEDFSRNTIGLYYVNETMVYGWRCSAEVIANTDGVLTGYRNTSANEAYLCGVEFDYPNCDVIPIITYNVSVNVTTLSGEPLASSVLLGGIESETGADGHADFLMPADTYFYRASASGYETKSGYFIVNDSDEAFNVKLRSYEEIARDAADALQIGFAEGDSADSVTAGLVLPTECEYGTISWTSDNGAVSEYGGVTRGEDDINVTLTAAVNVEGAVVTRDFDVTVKSRFTAEQRNKAIVSQDKADLEIGYAPGDYEGSVTVNLTLPETGAAGSTISWLSDNDDIITDSGAVIRQEYDTEVTLTAYIIRGTVTDIKTFTVTVKGTGKPAAVETPIPDDEEEVKPTPVVIDEPADISNEIVQRVVNALEIGYAKDDDADNVTDSITLQTVGTEGTTITWTSSHPAVITPYGGVVRQAEDTAVTLTATINRGDVTEIKTFTVTVKAADEIPQNPNNGQEEEIEEKNTIKRGGSGGGGGGGGAAETAEATPTPTPTTEPTPTTAAIQPDTTDKIRFIDIDVPWAQNAINTLADRGVISGTSANTYSPHLSIRRADFVMLLVKLYDLDTDITDTFEDVTEDKYYYRDVSKAKSLGIISGIDETHFNPESSISRQDMMTMTYRALKKLDKVKETENTDLTGFKDHTAVSDYALNAVKYLVGIGAIHGDTDGNLNPLANTTRAETAVFLFGLTQ